MFYFHLLVLASIYGISAYFISEMYYPKKIIQYTKLVIFKLTVHHQFVSSNFVTVFKFFNNYYCRKASF